MPQFAALGTSPPSVLFPLPAYQQPASLFRGRKEAGGAHGVQLRGPRDGGQVPRPRPPSQYHADRRGRGVAQDDAEELVVRRLRPRPRPRRRAQVRLRAGHARGVVQVPPPPQQLPGRHLRRAAAGRATVVLPHRRGAVTAPPISLKSEPRNARQQEEERREKKRGRTWSLLCDTRKGAYLFLPSS